MNYENLLLSRALQDRDLTPLFERRVSEAWFNNDVDRRVWVFARDHQSKYGECPSHVIITDNFPTYEFAKADDTIDFLIDKVMESRRVAIINSAIRTAIEDIELRHDHEFAVSSLQQGLSKLEEDGLNDVTDVDITFEAEKRWDDYVERKNLPNGLRGYATGFPALDKAMSGIQNGQLIVIVAPPKTGKSTLALQMAHNVHMGGAVPLFQSFEMSNNEQSTRYDAMRARLSHHRLLTGTLTPEEEVRYQAKLRSMNMLNHKFWLSQSASASTISGLANKIQTYRPDILFVDGVYLMQDEQSGEAGTPLSLTNITRSMKRMAQKYNIPIVISTQVLEWKMRKGQVTADSIGYSSSFYQDADILLALQREDEAVDDMRVLKLLAGRNTSPMEVSLLWDWNTGDFREITRDDL